MKVRSHLKKIASATFVEKTCATISEWRACKSYSIGQLILGAALLVGVTATNPGLANAQTNDRNQIF